MRKPGCLRAFVCVVLRARVVRPCASFVPVACFSTGPLLVLTLGAPTRYCVGASCVRAGGGRAGLLWACLLAGGWGWVFARGACSLVVFACLLVCARLGVVGQSLSRRPLCPGLLACVLTPLVWALLACARAGGRPGKGAVMGRDNHVPPHALLGGAAAVVCAWKRED